MSDLRVTNLRGRTSGSAPTLPDGAIVTGVTTSTSFDGSLIGDVTGSVTGNVTGNADTATYADSAGISTYAETAGISTYAETAGISTYAETAGIATDAQGLTGNPNLNVGIVTVSGLGGVAFATVTTTSVSKTIINREYCTVVAPGQTITLPASPQNGHEVGIAVSNFRDTTVTAGGNELIMGSTDDLTIDLAYSSIQLVYNSTGSVGWRFF